jgi:hypothetical protein
MLRNEKLNITRGQLENFLEEHLLDEKEKLGEKVKVPLGFLGSDETSQVLEAFDECVYDMTGEFFTTVENAHLSNGCG